MDGEELRRGRSALGEKPKDCRNKGQRTQILHHHRFPSPGRRQHLCHQNQERSSVLRGERGGYSSQYDLESSSIDDLEESLRELQVNGLSATPDPECMSEPESAPDLSPFSSRWPMAQAENYEESGIEGTPKPPADSEGFVKPNHFLRSADDCYSQTFARSAVNRVAGAVGNELGGRSPFPFVGLSFPLKLGSPHVIGVKALLPPKIPVKPRLPERASHPFDNSRSLSLARFGATRSRSLSPVSKRACWFRSQSQSPRPVWTPSCAKADPCSQSPPQLAKPKGVKKKTASNRPSRSRIYRPGVSAIRSRTPTWATRRDTQSSSWSPYSLSSTAISSPTAQELHECFLQTLAEGAVGRSMIQMSPYEQKMAFRQLERLRVEEEWLLELKRQQELERTRGPQPRWYEMKTPQFHYEAHKNNEFLRNSPDVESVYKYRQELTAASQEYQQQPNSTYLVTR